MRAASDDQRIQIARDAVLELDRVCALEPERAFLAKIDIARAAYAAGDRDRVVEVARELIETAEPHRKLWYYGNAIFHANTALGHVAIDTGDRDAARGYLLAAAETRGSPQLNSFGPDYSLAQHFLDLEEREAVIAFLEGCRKFQMHKDLLVIWQTRIANGETFELNQVLEVHEARRREAPFWWRGAVNLKLNEKTLERVMLPAGKKQLIVWDEELPGFGIVIGRRIATFVANYWANGVKRRQVIGRRGDIRDDGQPWTVTLARLRAARSSGRSPAAAIRASNSEGARVGRHSVTHSICTCPACARVARRPRASRRSPASATSTSRTGSLARSRRSNVVTAARSTSTCRRSTARTWRIA